LAIFQQMPEKPKVRWWVVLLLFALAALCLPFASGQFTKTSTCFFCQNCGVRIYHTSLGPFRSKSLQETKLSRWYAEHYPSDCVHSRHYNHGSSRTIWSLWGRAGGAGSYMTPGLIFLFPDEEADLNRRFTEDPAKCKAYIAEQLHETVEE
jgi:hypothetical protein